MTDVMIPLLTTFTYPKGIMSMILDIESTDYYF